MCLIDLSQTISNNMPRFSESAPQPTINAWMSHADADASGRYMYCSCEITQVNMLTSIGTYIDSPFHFVPEGNAIHQLSLEQTVLPAVCIDCGDLKADQEILVHVLDDVDVADKAVLFCTRWDRFWGKPEYMRYPYLGRGVAEALRDRGAKLAGVDYLAIDNQDDPTRPVHTTLLRNNILIVENLTGLAPLIGQDFVFHAVPVKVEGAAAFPVRAYAMLGYPHK